MVEPFGKLTEQAAAEGVLRGAGRGELDLGTIAEGLLEQLVRHPLLDREAPFKSRRTQLRRAARLVPAGEAPSLDCFTLAEDGSRTVELRLPEGTPAVDHLLRLWMPRARVDPELGHLQGVLEREPGFSRQWENLRHRIRDQLAMRAVSLTPPGLGHPVGPPPRP